MLLLLHIWGWRGHLRHCGLLLLVIGRALWLLTLLLTLAAWHGTLSSNGARQDRLVHAFPAAPDLEVVLACSVETVIAPRLGARGAVVAVGDVAAMRATVLPILETLDIIAVVVAAAVLCRRELWVEVRGSLGIAVATLRASAIVAVRPLLVRLVLYRRRWGGVGVKGELTHELLDGVHLLSDIRHLGGYVGLKSCVSVGEVGDGRLCGVVRSSEVLDGLLELTIGVHGVLRGAEAVSHGGGGHPDALA